jgi:hypothetical protein
MANPLPHPIPVDSISELNKVAVKISEKPQIWYDPSEVWKLDANGNDKRWHRCYLRISWDNIDDQPNWVQQKEAHKKVQEMELEIQHEDKLFQSEGEAKQWAAARMLEKLSGNYFCTIWNETWVYCAKEDCQRRIAQRKALYVDNNSVAFISKNNNPRYEDYQRLFDDVDIHIENADHPYLRFIATREGGLTPQFATGIWTQFNSSGSGRCPKCFAQICDLAIREKGKETCTREDHPLYNHPKRIKEIIGDPKERVPQVTERGPQKRGLEHQRGGAKTYTS